MKNAVRQIRASPATDDRGDSRITQGCDQGTGCCRAIGHVGDSKGPGHGLPLEGTGHRLESPCEQKGVEPHSRIAAFRRTQNVDRENREPSFDERRCVTRHADVALARPAHTRMDDDRARLRRYMEPRLEHDTIRRHVQSDIGRSGALHCSKPLQAVGHARGAAPQGRSPSTVSEFGEIERWTSQPSESPNEAPPETRGMATSSVSSTWHA
jgi:hypothetical protein